MSIGSPHHRPNHRHQAELHQLMATPSFKQMWARPFRVDTSKEVPDTAGYNVLGDVYFVDSFFAAAVRAGKIVVPGMSPQQILHAILLHERIEKCVLDADNDVNSYEGAHEFATLAEHLFVISCGAKPRLYEAALKPYIRHNETKPLTNVDRNLDCEPYNDEPDAEDKTAIAAMLKLGVTDAGKAPKEPFKYGRSTGTDQCQGCKNWMAGKPVDLSPCAVISGVVRNTYWCTQFKENGDGQADSSAAPQDAGIGVRGARQVFPAQ